MIARDAHPLLLHGAFMTSFPHALGDMPSPAWLTQLLALDADAPVRRDERVRKDIRDLLRLGGYKPTGRGKPASEYLVRAAGQAALSSINLAVDTCNAVSLHSGLPISMIDLDRAEPPLRIGIAAAGQSYAFNASGQTIDLTGLLCLHDARGPCANAVKDSQRTKTDDRTRKTLSIVWCCIGLEEQLSSTVKWYRELLHRAGTRTDGV